MIGRDLHVAACRRGVHLHGVFSWHPAYSRDTVKPHRLAASCGVIRPQIRPIADPVMQNDVRRDTD